MPLTICQDFIVEQQKRNNKFGDRIYAWLYRWSSQNMYIFYTNDVKIATK